MKKTENRALTFLRRNAVYFILALCIIAVGLSVTLILLNQDKLPNDQIQVENPGDDLPGDEPVDGNNPNEPDTPVDGNNPNEPDTPVDGNNPNEPDTPVQTVIAFVMPVANATEITEYSETMVYNSTLNRFSAHKAIDFFATQGTDVLAVWEGTVESVNNSPLTTGVTVTIDHGNGLKTIYNSLDDSELVSVGQTVTKGQKIGEVSVSNRQEYKSGAHLHFEVVENDVRINPSKYLSFDEK